MLQALLQDLRQLDASRKALRSFGLLVGGVLTLISAWLIWRSGSANALLEGRLSSSVVVGGIGLLLMIFGALWPKTLRPIHFVWMALALVLGAVMTRIVLSIGFVILIVPVGLVMKLVGRDPLSRDFHSSRSTFWISREDMDRSPERLEKYY